MGSGLTAVSRETPSGRENRGNRRSRSQMGDVPRHLYQPEPGSQPLRGYCSLRHFRVWRNVAERLGRVHFHGGTRRSSQTLVRNRFRPLDAYSVVRAVKPGDGGSQGVARTFSTLVGAAPIRRRGAWHRFPCPHPKTRPPPSHPYGCAPTRPARVSWPVQSSKRDTRRPVRIPRSRREPISSLFAQQRQKPCRSRIRPKVCPPFSGFRIFSHSLI